MLIKKTKIAIVGIQGLPAKYGGIAKAYCAPDGELDNNSPQSILANPDSLEEFTGLVTDLKNRNLTEDEIKENEEMWRQENAFAKYEKGISDLSKTGATIIVFTVIDRVEGNGKTAQLWHERFSAFNVNVREVANKYGATIIESDDAKWMADLRFLAKDRLILSFH